MKKNKWLWLLISILLLALTISLILEKITNATFLSISGICIVMFFLYMVGFETISEINVGVASIKRDVQAAKEIREEMEKISSDLKSVIKLSAENTYIVARSSSLGTDSHTKARERFENNNDALIDFIEPDKQIQEEWWEELNSNIRRDSSNDFIMPDDDTPDFPLPHTKF